MSTRVFSFISCSTRCIVNDTIYHDTRQQPTQRKALLLLDKRPRLADRVDSE